MLHSSPVLLGPLPCFEDFPGPIHDLEEAFNSALLACSSHFFEDPPDPEENLLSAVAQSNNKHGTPLECQEALCPNLTHPHHRHLVTVSCYWNVPILPSTFGLDLVTFQRRMPTNCLPKCPQATSRP